MDNLTSGTEGCHSEEAKVLVLLAHLQIRLTSTKKLLEILLESFTECTGQKNSPGGDSELALMVTAALKRKKETIWVPLGIIHITFFLGTLS